jgi:hypothetical protein
MITWRYDIWAIDAQQRPIEGTETKGIRGKQKAFDQAIALFKTSPILPWRVVVQPRVYSVNGTRREVLETLCKQSKESKSC